jgi:uncharacterized protein (TIGR04255 family)
VAASCGSHIFDTRLYNRIAISWRLPLPILLRGEMNWEPSRADHSIDRATASIVLAEHLDANTLDELVVAARKAAAAHHLTNRIDLVEPLEIPAGQAVNLNMPPPRRVVFRRLDSDGVSVEELSIGTSRIIFGTMRYGRWADFFGRFESCLNDLHATYPVMDHARTVRLEYLDRFNSTSEEADHFEVIRRDSEFLPPVVAPKTAALHAHCGWFDFDAVGVRKLTAVNIDVSDVPIPPPPPPDRKRTVTILSVGQFEALEGMLDRPVQRLDTLHDDLKYNFGRIITPDAAKRIALND